jgi:hypothetical protein
MKLVDDNNDDIIQSFQNRIQKIESNKDEIIKIVKTIDIKYQSIIDLFKNLNTVINNLNIGIGDLNIKISKIEHDLHSKEDNSIINIIINAMKSFFTKKNNIKETTINLE